MWWHNQSDNFWVSKIFLQAIVYLQEPCYTWPSKLFMMLTLSQCAKCSPLSLWNPWIQSTSEKVEFQNRPTNCVIVVDQWQLKGVYRTPKELHQKVSFGEQFRTVEMNSHGNPARPRDSTHHSIAGTQVYLRFNTELVQIIWYMIGNHVSRCWIDYCWFTWFGFTNFRFFYHLTLLNASFSSFTVH